MIPVVGCDYHGKALAESNLGASIGHQGLRRTGTRNHHLAASGGHVTFSGSSAAVPFVAGTLAHLWSVFSQASTSQIPLAVTGGLYAQAHQIIPPPLDGGLRTGHRARQHGSGCKMTETTGTEENKSPLRMRLPGFIKDEEVGLGDAIKRMTYTFGVKPCGGCEQSGGRAQPLDGLHRMKRAGSSEAHSNLIRSHLKPKSRA